MANQIPLITIAITCYNALETIESAVESAQKQDWPNLEILVVDDHSIDGSMEHLKSLAEQDKRIRLLQHEQNMGVGAARNTLVDNARGEFIVFFDDDDISQPTRVSTQYARIAGYENAIGTDLVASYCAREQVLPGGERRYVATLGMDMTPGPPPERVAELILLGRPTDEGSGACATCSLMARKSVFDRVGGFNPALRRGEDTDLNIRLALIGCHFAGISAPLVVQRITDTEDKHLTEERRNQLQRIELHRDVLVERGWYEFASNWIHLKFNALEHKWPDAAGKAFGLLIAHPIKLAKRLLWLLQSSLRNKQTLAKLKL